MVALEHQRLKRPPQKVQDQAEAFLRPINDGTYTPASTQTLGEFIECVYFPNISSEKRDSTVSGYHSRWESQLKARCANFKLRDFNTADGTKLLADIARADPTLLRTTLQHLRNFLSGVFTHAIRQGYLPAPVNPMRYATVPHAPEGQETYAYSLEEITRILVYLPQPAYTIAAIAAFTGLRRAELRGLQWPDYSGSEIMVCRSVWELHVNEPKTRKSKAPVTVITPLRKILDAWREHCGNPTSGFLFVSGHGTPLNVNNLEKRVIRPVLRKAGVEWHGWHPFRRGLGTNLHRLGVADKVIQQILRHSRIATTMDIYVKSASTDSVAAMKLLETALLCADRAPAAAPMAAERVNGIAENC